jgi:tetratricopeptide (TPR) repeat protein
MDDNSKPANLPSSTSEGPQQRTIPSSHSQGAARSFKRLLVVVVGLIIVMFGAFYSWWGTRQTEESRQSEEYRGWQAYQAGKDSEALAYFNKAISKRPDSAEAYTGRSWVEVGRQQWDKALADSMEALRLNPKLTDACIAKANALAGLDKVSAAMKELNEAIRDDPKSAEAYYYRARIGYANSVKDANPLADVQEAIRLKPDDAAPYALLGYIEWKGKHYDAAIAACNKALARNPRDVLALTSRGQAYLAKGNVAEGNADLQEAQRLAPQQPKTDLR